jgi:hypothetical protein
MLDSPLKKNKHSYPIDFSTRKKSPNHQSSIKYDKIPLDDENPEHIALQKKASMGMSASSISELFIDTSKKQPTKNHFEFF